MRRFFVIAVMSALVLAKPKPETYRETEDFQFSRSSSDDGHKSGFYGAQRGNMGGNFERAHNMDVLAQHQMSGLVRQVDGELGEGSKTRTGSVYTAANSRGIYGSGNYDISNLKGRNFDEGESFGSSQAHSSLTSHNSGYRDHLYSGMNSAGFSSSNRQAQQSRYSGYQSLGHEDQRHIDNLQSVDTSRDFNGYEKDKNGYVNYAQYGTHGKSELDQSSTKLHNTANYAANSQSRYITTPVRVVVRPTGRVAIPIAAQTYDVSQSTLTEDKNAINSEAEVLNQHTNVKPTNKVKHYESSYSYRKEWEKHHTQPAADVSVVEPTENPFAKHSELYDDAQLLETAKNQFENANLQTGYANIGINSERRSNTQSAASSQSRFTSGFNSQQSHSDVNAQQSSVSSDANTNAYGQRAQTSGMAADLTNAATNLNLKPKSYHSSYSYHKSWERQGDPYVIQPVGGIYEDQSQRLTAASSKNAAYSSHQYGSHSRQTQKSYLDDCDEEGHLRVSRSYNSEKELEQHQNQKEDLNQHTQNRLEKLEDFDYSGQQQTRGDNLQDLGQQTLNHWENFHQSGQETQNQWDNLQQSQQETHNQWDNLQQSEQEPQNHWDNIQQLGEQSQDKYDKLEDFGQQSQNDLEQNQNENIEDFSQNSQKEDILTNFEQQTNGADIFEEQKSSTQKQNYPNDDIWNHTIGFKPQSNTSIADEILQTHSVNRHEINNNFFNQHKFDDSDQSQTNLWHQNENTNSGKNIDSDNFKRPTFDSKSYTEQNFQQKVENVPFSVDNKQNLFPTSSNPINYDSQWDQNNKQYVPWNLHHHQNTNYETQFWHMNEFNNIYSHHENNFNSNNFPVPENGTSLSSLWNKIDNIGGEFSSSQGNTDDKHYSNFYTHSQNGYTWEDIPDSSKLERPQIHTNNNNEEKHIGHHNLFDDETQRTSTHTTSLRPNKILLSHSSPSSAENASTQPFHHAQNTPSPDVGRGDIGPEETYFENTKDNEHIKTPEEIESLSLTKEPHVTKPDDIIMQPHSITNNDEKSTENTMFLMNLNIQQRPSQNRQYKLFSTFQSQISTTTPIVQTTSTLTTLYQDKHRPILDGAVENNLSSINIQEQKPQKQTGTVETLGPIQEQTLDQQSEEFDQEQQNSWLPSDNLKHGYDQQNVEEQFDGFKPHVNEIAHLSVTKETDVIKTSDDNIQQNLMKNNNVHEGNQLGFKTSNNQENLNNQYLSFSTSQSKSSTSTPTVQILSTAKSSHHLYDDNQKPSLELTTLRNSLTTDLQRNNPQTQNIANLDIQDNRQQEQQFQEFGQQLQSSWYPSDKMQQEYNQQNMEQQFEVFHQSENMNMQDQTSLRDFGQQAQSSIEYLKDFGQEAQSSIEQLGNMAINSQQFEDRVILSNPNNYKQKVEPSVDSKNANSEFQQLIEPGYISSTDPRHSDDSNDKNNSNKYSQPNSPRNQSLNSSSESDTKIVQSPTETSMQNPGFWKSVGNKFSNAKNKVFSWFRSS